MISINQRKQITSLNQKKYRIRHGLFLAEGEKITREALAPDTNPFSEVREIFATPEWLQENQELINASKAPVTEASTVELKKVSTLQTPPRVIALLSLPELSHSPPQPGNNLLLVLESIRDPGNLGTILRTANWFGITTVICSEDSTDAWNPKVVQASMGAVLRTTIHYIPLVPFLESYSTAGGEVYGTHLRGKSIYSTPVKTPSLVIFGNESRGLSPNLEKLVTTPIRIPDHPPGKSGTESLNIAASVAAVCAIIRNQSASTQNGN